MLVTQADGTHALQTLADLGITSIDLDQDKTRIALPDGSSIDGQTTFSRGDGSTGTAATVTLAYEANGTALQSTTTRNADGSTTIDTRQIGRDGRVVADTASTTSADGLSISTRFDGDGDGIVDRLQTDVTSDTDHAGHLLDTTVTTTSPDGKTVSIARDRNGGGRRRDPGRRGSRRSCIRATSFGRRETRCGIRSRAA